MSDLGREASKFLDRIVPTTKVMVGASAGWLTGYLTMKYGKMMSVTLGSGVILLQLAATEGHLSAETCLIGSSFIGGLLIGVTFT